MRRIVVECKACTMVLGIYRAASAPMHATAAAASAAEHHDTNLHDGATHATVRDTTPLETMLLYRLEQLEDAVGVGPNGGS